MTQADIIDALARFERQLELRVTEHPTSGILRDALAYHFGFAEYGPVRIGKRLRPQMLLRTALAFGGAVDDALDPAVAIEVLHNYSLVHDDIEDRDELRHGRATLWAQFGIAQAINTGDAMCACSFLALLQSESQLGPKRTLAAVRSLHQAHLTMCDGQARDLGFEGRDVVTVDEYVTMIAGKTAALFRCACELGAIAADAPENDCMQAAAFGESYGLAFQIRDDLLGIWGDERATGKRVAGDIARRKWSYPIVWALSRPASAAREIVERAYATEHTLDESEVAAVREALDEVGAQNACRSALDERIIRLQRSSDASLLAFAIESLR